MPANTGRFGIEMSANTAFYTIEIENLKDSAPGFQLFSSTIGNP